MWPLAKIGLQHVGLTRGLGQRFELAPRYHAHITGCFQPGMVPDRADVAVGIRRRSLAGRIDQPALINVIEVLRNALAQFLKNGLGAEAGAFVRRRILGEPPTEPVHSDLAGSTWVTFHPPVPIGGSASLDRSGRSPQAPRPSSRPCAIARAPIFRRQRNATTSWR